MSSKIPQIIAKLKTDFGDSNEESRQITKEAHGDIEAMKEGAEIWAEHHAIVGLQGDIFISYATAIDLGVRIGLKKGREEKNEEI